KNKDSPLFPFPSAVLFVTVSRYCSKSLLQQIPYTQFFPRKIFQPFIKPFNMLIFRNIPLNGLRPKPFIYERF
ncbi:MAG: hypothetical protein ACI3X6_02975, partial [Alloprevotella sp.]